MPALRSEPPVVGARPLSRAPVLLALLLAVLVLGPVLVRPGTVLLHDMVFVPRQPLGPQELGLGGASPRSVPVDAVVSALTALVPGGLLQRIALLGALVLAGAGAARLCPATGLVGRCGAAVAYAWNPWVAERLVVGHWALLIGYAALPWIAAAGLAVRRGEGGARPRALVSLAAASLTPSGGLLGSAVLVAGAGRRWLSPSLVLGTLALQAPWVVAGILAPGSGRSDPAAVGAFALRAENWSGTLGSALGLGGIWNAQVVPGSRTTVVAPLLTLLALGLAALGARPLVARWGRPAVAALATTAAAGLALALAGAVPVTADGLALLVEHVPGAGLLRDAHKWLAPLALLLAVLAGLGCERLAAGRGRTGLAALAVLLPLATTPDLAWGAAGRLDPVRWPGDWSAVADELAADPDSGALVSLPFTAYRAYGWNDRRPSLDPAPRWFDGQVVVEDRLMVDDLVLDGEDPRAEAVRGALASGRPLGELGVGWVLEQRGTPGVVPASATRGAVLVHDGPDLSLWRLPDVRQQDPAAARTAPVIAAHLLAVVVAAGAALACWRPARRRWLAWRREH